MQAAKIVQSDEIVAHIFNLRLFWIRACQIWPTYLIQHVGMSNVIFMIDRGLKSRENTYFCPLM